MAVSIVATLNVVGAAGCPLAACAAGAFEACAAGACEVPVSAVAGGAAAAAGGGAPDTATVATALFAAGGARSLTMNAIKPQRARIAKTAFKILSIVIGQSVLAFSYKNGWLNFRFRFFGTGRAARIKSDGQAHYCVGSIRTSKVPSLTCPPVAALSSAIVPSKGEVRLCSIFIASRVTSFWPLETDWPGETSTAMILPGIGEKMVPSDV